MAARSVLGVIKPLQENKLMFRGLALWFLGIPIPIIILILLLW